MTPSTFSILLGILIIFFTSAQDLNQSPCPAPDNKNISFSKWIPCEDYSKFNCRNITVPRVYYNSSNPKSNGTLYQLERRLIKGTPKRYIFLVSGGPGGNADLLSLVVAPQFESALVNDFAIHIPSRRGTPHTQRIPTYEGFPANFNEQMKRADLPAEAWTTTNSARDLIASVKNAKEEYPNASFHAAGFSHGTLLIQRILQIEPALFNSVLLDGTLSTVNTSNQFYFQSLGLASLSQLIDENCQRSDFCRNRSLRGQDLALFLDSLQKGKSNICVDQFVKTIAPGAPAGEVINNIIYQYSMQSTIEILPTLLSSNTSDPKIQQDFINMALNTFNSNISKPGFIQLDFRVFAWSLLNQLAQCNNNSARNISFNDAVKFFYVLTQSTANLVPPMLSPASPLGNEYVTQILELLSEGRLPLTNSTNIAEQQKKSPLRNPAGSIEREKQLTFETKDFAPPLDCYSNKVPQNVSANILILNGLLDPNVPNQMSVLAFNSIGLAPGFTKVNYTHLNAGHTVISLGWSLCVQNLIKGYFNSDSASMASYERCLIAENNKTLDWEASTLKNLTGFNVWNGLPYNSSNSFHQRNQFMGEVFLVWSIVLLYVVLCF